MSAVAVIEPDDKPTLDELAATINREHDLVIHRGESMVRHAILAGDALLKARSEVHYGAWHAWVETNTNLSISCAAKYARLATYKGIVGNAPTINAARRMLNDRPAIVRAGSPPRAWLTEAKELHAKGATLKQIAEIVGVTVPSVHMAVNPEKAQTYTEKRTTLRRQRSAERKAFKRQERDSAMKKAGGDAWDAYVLVRKLAPLLDQLNLGPSYAKCVAIEDELVQLVRSPGSLR